MANRRAIASNVDCQVDRKNNSDRAKYLFETAFYCDCEFLVGNVEEKRGIYFMENSLINCILKKAFHPTVGESAPNFPGHWGVVFFGGMAQPNAGRSVSTGSDAIEVQDIQPFAFKDLLELVYSWVYFINRIQCNTFNFDRLFIYTEHVDLKSFE